MLENDVFTMPRDVFTTDTDSPVAEQTLSSGMTMPDSGYAQEKITDDARDIRYFFNPFMVCDTRGLSAPIGYQFLPNGQFIKIGAVTEHRTVPDYSYTNLPSPYDRSSPVDRNTRQPGQIANDIITIFSPHGVTEITALRGVDDDKTTDILSKRILGESIQYKTDIYFSDHPCPILPLWNEQIEANVRQLLEQSHDERTIALIKSIGQNVRQAIVRARTVAQALVTAAITRTLQPNAANKNFDALERRAFLALGQEIPDQLPTVSQSSNERNAKVEDALLSIAQRQVEQQVIVPSLIDADSDALKESRDANAKLSQQLAEQTAFMQEMRREMLEIKNNQPKVEIEITDATAKTDDVKVETAKAETAKGKGK